MPGTKYIPFGGLGYWTNGKVLRIPGRKGFEKVNSFYGQRYIKNLEKFVKDTLHHKLPTFVQSFLNSKVVKGSIPWDSGNLHDSIVGAVVYRKENGGVSLAGGKAFHARPVARKPQHWGLALGGYDEHLVRGAYRRSSMYQGYGKEYAANYQYAIRDPDEIVLENNVVVVLEATIPYAIQANDNEGPLMGWFNDLSEMFENQLRQELGVIVSEVSTDEGIEYGIATQIGF